MEQNQQDISEIRYGDAMAELEGLLDEIDGNEVDLDELAIKVERASQLINMCRGKIEQTEMQVKAIIEGLAEPDAERE
ncbi:exodeoxyribonuclease VII small subunit [Bradymonas sediminis]|nr:exodeoxyribonuclease VII small subunit [Bradymonas sediminis]TDP73615.1 exodeoxyribonuclease VII small subunit [Bradymonas sediminis]